MAVLRGRTCLGHKYITRVPRLNPHRIYMVAEHTGSGYMVLQHFETALVDRFVFRLQTVTPCAIPSMEAAETWGFAAVHRPPFQQLPGAARERSPCHHAEPVPSPMPSSVDSARPGVAAWPASSHMAAHRQDAHLVPAAARCPESGSAPPCASAPPA